MPYAEGGEFWKLLLEDPEEFWKRWEGVSGRVGEDGFKELFLGMMRKEPGKRARMEEIEGNLWYQGKVLSGEELKKEVEKVIG